MIKAKAVIENPGGVDVTITITMPKQYWDKIKEDLSNQHPSSELDRVLFQILHKIDREVFENSDI